MNAGIRRLTGRAGSISERIVYNLLAGVHRRPHAKTMASLEAVFGCPAEDLGLVAPAERRPPPPPKGPVDRRAFLATGSAAAAGTVLAPVGQRPASVGAGAVLAAGRIFTTT